MDAPQSYLCKGCWTQLRMPIVLRGPLAVPFRLVGLRPSRMNPNLCTLCETMFSRVMRTQQKVVPATILFADVRGYTSLSEVLDHTETARLLSGFYEQCARAVWEHDGIVNKLIGDAALAIFNWPIVREDHVEQAVLAAVALQEAWDRRQTAADAAAAAASVPPVQVGVGLHTGLVSVGEFGEFCRDYTVIGPVVNVAARLQGAAAPGEVLMSDDVYQHVAAHYPDAVARICHLKGVEQPVRAYAVSLAGERPLVSDEQPVVQG